MMSGRAQWRQSAAAARIAMNVARPRQALFLLSHMRSYSSLLCHILNSNPEVDGYGELGIPYRTPLDLINMRYQIRLTTGNRLQGRYALDKVLHPTVELADAILTSPSATVMVGVREPDASVRSIRAMGMAKAKPDWKADPKRSVRGTTFDASTSSSGQSGSGRTCSSSRPTPCSTTPRPSCPDSRSGSDSPSHSRRTTTWVR